MSVAEKGPGIQYSAEAPGSGGRVGCHVLRSHGVHDVRVRYTIAVRNETAADAQAFAFVPDAPDLRYRTIVQTTIAPYSDFATTIELELARYGGMPNLHIELSGDDLQFALVVPSSHARLDAQTLAIAPQTAMPRATCLPFAPVRETLLAPAETGAPAIQNGQHGNHASELESEPQAKKTSFVSVKPASALPMAALLVLAPALAGVWLLRPHVDPLVVPQTALAGAKLAITYRAAGLGDVDYRVVGPDAGSVATGALTNGRGTFFVSLPKDPSARAYLVRVGIDGILGAQFAEAYVKVPEIAATILPRPHTAPPEPPQIRSLALDRAALTGGDTLNVYYDVSATSGTVSLLDAASQIPYGKSTLSPTGHTSFVVPIVRSERYLSVVVSAKRGTASTVSRVAVTAAPQSSPTPASDASGIPVEGADGSVTAQPVIVAPKTVQSGQPIHVDIRGAVPGLVLVLNDNNGDELARREIEMALAQTSVSFTAPTIKRSTRVRLQATYPQGAGSETIVETVDVRSH